MRTWQVLSHTGLHRGLPSVSRGKLTVKPGMRAAYSYLGRGLSTMFTAPPVVACAALAGTMIRLAKPTAPAAPASLASRRVGLSQVPSAERSASLCLAQRPPVRRTPQPAPAVSHPPLPQSLG
jgi:hypothetical protein